MTISQLIQIEFLDVFPSILTNKEVRFSSEDLFDCSNLTNIEVLNSIKGLTGVYEKERTSLINFIELMDEAESLLDYDEEINKRLLDYIDTYPGVKPAGNNIR